MQGQRFAVDECQLALEKLSSSLGLAQAMCQDTSEPSPQQRLGEIQESVKGLHAQLDSLTSAASSTLKDQVSLLVARAQDGAAAAAGEAADTMLPKCQSKKQGGMLWNTFKATVRRDGEWKEDFNEILSAPLSRRIAVKWDEVFNRVMPQAMTKTFEAYRAKLRRFEQVLEQSVGSRAHLLVEPALQLLSDRYETSRKEAKARQKEGTRNVKESMKTQMLSTYSRSHNVPGGTGIDERQKAVLKAKIQDSTGCSTMFAVVKDSLVHDINTIVGWFTEQTSEWAGAVVGSILGRLSEQNCSGAANARDRTADDLRAAMSEPTSQFQEVCQELRGRLTALRQALESIEAQQLAASRAMAAALEGCAALEPPPKRRRLTRARAAELPSSGPSAAACMGEESAPSTGMDTGGAADESFHLEQHLEAVLEEEEDASEDESAESEEVCQDEDEAEDVADEELFSEDGASDAEMEDAFY